MQAFPHPLFSLPCALRLLGFRHFFPTLSSFSFRLRLFCILNEQNRTCAKEFMENLTLYFVDLFRFFDRDNKEPPQHLKKRGTNAPRKKCCSHRPSTCWKSSSTLPSHFSFLSSSYVFHSKHQQFGRKREKGGRRGGDFH